MSNIPTSENKHKVENVTKPNQTIEEKTYSKKKLDTIIQKTQKQTEEKTKELVKKKFKNN